MTETKNDGSRYARTANLIWVNFSFRLKRNWAMLKISLTRMGGSAFFTTSHLSLY